MSEEPLPDVTMRPGPQPGPDTRRRSEPKKFRWSWLSAVVSTALLFLVGPLVVVLSVVITDNVGNKIGALSMVLGGTLVLLLQFATWVLAIIGFVVRGPKNHLGFAAFLMGLLTMAAIGLLMYSAIDDLL
jgi:VIT1/CCC1 family predicted Fe2+/Mn2+ transporter